MSNYRRKLMMAQIQQSTEGITHHTLPPEYQEVEYISAQEASCLSFSGLSGYEPEFELETFVTTKYLGQQQVFLHTGTFTPIRSPKVVLDTKYKSVTIDVPHRQGYSTNHGFEYVDEDSFSAHPGTYQGRFRIIQKNGWVTVQSYKDREEKSIDVNRNKNWYILPEDVINIVGLPKESQGGLYGDLYYFKFWLDKKLVLDLIPCYEKATGLVGVYNLVDKTFHTSSGLYPFGNGPDIQ